MRLAAAAVRAGRQDACTDDADAAAAELACNDAGSFMAISPDVHMAQGRLADSSQPEATPSPAQWQRRQTDSLAC